MMNDRKEESVLDRVFFFVSISFLVVVFLGVVWSQEKVPFPEGYEKFRMVQESIIKKGNPLYPIVPGYNKTLLNDVAYSHYEKYIKDYKKGVKPPPFPEGSIIIFLNYGEDRKEQKLLVIMHKDKKFGQTGGWGWEAFKLPGKERVVADADKDCANCHYKSPKSWDGAFFEE